MIPVLSGIANIADQYDAFIFDIWGVLHDGLRPYEGVIDCLHELKLRDKSVLLLSNSPNRGEVVTRQVLSPMGITPDLFDHIVTSGDSTFDAMTKHAGKNVYCFYDHENPTALENAPVTRVYDIEQADFALISHLPWDVTEHDYDDVLRRCLNKGMTVICANPDKIVGVGNSTHICAGAIADVYEAMGGKVSWHGKPHRPIYDRAFELLGHPDKPRVMAVGDSLRTDVTGATNYGIDVLWNAVGIHWQEITNDNNISQDKIADAVSHLPDRPTAILHGLQW